MAIQLRLAGHDKDLGGGFTVRRLLPAARQRSVGPFIFFDHFGPVTVPAERELRCAAPSAHRPGDGHLPFRRRDDASRQPGQRSS